MGFSFNRLFKIQNTAASAEFIISDMSFSYSAIRLPFDEYGGAILASHVGGASLTLERLNFLSNNAEKGGGALAIYGGNSNTTLIKDSEFANNFVSGVDANTAGGGAIFIGGYQNVTIERSSFYGNYVFNTPLANAFDDMAGGAILMLSSTAAAASELTIDHCTFSANQAVGVGGALSIGGPSFPGDSSTVTIKHSTFTLNEADTNNDQNGNDRGGGGIYSSATLPINIFNTIAAANTDQADPSAPDLSGTYNSNGYNLIGNNQGVSSPFPSGQPNSNDDTVGTNAQNIDTKLSPLADNGGPTLTHQLLPTSPAIDQGKCNAPTIDQRHSQNSVTGFRAIDLANVPNLLSGCDIGAVEFGSVTADPLPVANGDSYSVLEGQDLVVASNQGLLQNDVDDDALVVITAGSFAAISTDANGTVELLPDGSFMFSTDDSDNFGSADFVYTISDTLNRSSANVNINVVAVNDAPSFNSAQTMISATQGQSMSFPAWATEISPGPSNEVAQNLVFTVNPVNVPPGFFTVLPTVNAQSGNLSFTVAANAIGQAEASVTLQDNGGTANGGQNSYATTLTVQVSDLIFALGFEL